MGGEISSWVNHNDVFYIFNSGSAERFRGWLRQIITFPTENVLSCKKCCNLGQYFDLFFSESAFRSSLDHFTAKYWLGRPLFVPICFRRA